MAMRQSGIRQEQTVNQVYSVMLSIQKIILRKGAFSMDFHFVKHSFLI